MTSLNIGRTLSLHRAESDRAMQMRRLDMARAQEQLSTGLRVNRASDDPTAFSQARRFDAIHDRYTQYLDTIEASQPWIDRTQDGLDDIADHLTDIYERGLRAQSQAFDPDDRAAEATRIEGMVDELTDMLNRRDGDEYLFAGTRTTVVPFSQTGTTISYAGNEGKRTRQIGDGAQVAINISGDRVLDTGAGYTLSDAVQSIADAVRSGDPTQFATALDRIVTARDHVLELGAEAGGTASRLDLAAGQLREASLTVEARRSDVEDADIAATILAFQEAQTGLQAALKVTASILQTSLLDYLR